MPHIGIWKNFIFLFEIFTENISSQNKIVFMRCIFLFLTLHEFCIAWTLPFEIGPAQPQLVIDILVVSPKNFRIKACIIAPYCTSAFESISFFYLRCLPGIFLTSSSPEQISLISKLSTNLSEQIYFLP